MFATIPIHVKTVNSYLYLFLSVREIKTANKNVQFRLSKILTDYATIE